MSRVQDNQTVWSVKENVASKYEKCLNITEEIYKRINITFQIKKLETEAQSDVSEQSDHIDSNELSNETDLFACDKSSISSSTEAAGNPPVKYININNNEEKPKPVVVYKRPRKRFRKRVKKRQSKQQKDSDGSSDEALPLSRIVDIDIDKCASEDQESSNNVMGVPNILILAKDSKPKNKEGNKKKLVKDNEVTQIANDDAKKEKDLALTVDMKKTASGLESQKDEKGSVDVRSCSFCNLSFRSNRSLRRHISMSHVCASDIKSKSTSDVDLKNNW